MDTLNGPRPKKQLKKSLGIAKEKLPLNVKLSAEEGNMRKFVVWFNDGALKNFYGTSFKLEEGVLEIHKREITHLIPVCHIQYVTVEKQ